MNKFNFLLSAFFLLIILSCSKEDADITNLRVDHYQQTAEGLNRTLVLKVQEGNEIGTSTWKNFFGVIEGFKYESGYLYDLEIYKIKVKDPLPDASSYRYILKNITAKTRVSEETSFSVSLKCAMCHPPLFVTGNQTEGFKILDKILINCNTLCAELQQVLQDKPKVEGIFTHLGPNNYKLTGILTE